MDLISIRAYSQLKQVSEDSIYPCKCSAVYFLFYSISFFSDGDQLNKLISGSANGLQPMVLKTLC